MVDRCVRKDSSSCDPRQQVEGDVAGITTRGVHPHLSTIRFSFYAMVLLNLCI